jgi:hypothetical protein
MNNLKSILCCSLLATNIACNADELFNYLGFGFTTIAIGYGIFHQLIIRSAFPKKNTRSTGEQSDLKKENERLKVQLTKFEQGKSVQLAQQKAASLNSIELEKLMQENKRLMARSLLLLS